MTKLILYIAPLLAVSILVPNLVHAKIIDSILCEQFYSNDARAMVYELLKRRAENNMKLPLESYSLYLNKFFPELSDVERLKLMTYLKPNEIPFQISSNWIISRRLLRGTGSSEVTVENMRTLAIYLDTHSNKPKTDLYNTIRAHLIQGRHQGLNTIQILATLPK